MPAVKKVDLVSQRIQTLVANGALKDGQRIPSVREMASQMDLSMMTVLDAYRRLEAEGVIESRPRSGYYVRPKPLRDCDAWTRLPVACQTNIELRTEAVKVPPSIERLMRSAASSDMVPLGAGLPHPDHLPGEALSLHLARVARANPSAVNRYCLGHGAAPLREEIEKLMIAAGCSPAPDEIIITSGITQALLLALRALTEPGDTVAVESPGYFGFFGTMQFLHLHAMEIPSHPVTGLSIEALEQALAEGANFKCLLLSPNYSNPTGALIPDERKERLIELCRHHRMTIIEDDTYGEFSFDGSRPRPLKALCESKVIHLGSFSKVLAPGYRIAWVAGGRHADDILRCHKMAALSQPFVTQLAVAGYLAEGGYRQHNRRLRDRYQQNVRLFQNVVAESFPEGTRTANPQGGMFLWVELPEEADAVLLTERAAEANISIAPGVIFSSRGHYGHHIRLNCGVDCDEQIVAALRTVGKLANELRG